VEPSGERWIMRELEWIEPTAHSPDVEPREYAGHEMAAQ